MAEEHIFDRLTKAKTAEQNAVAEVNKLTEAFAKAARQLGAWRVVSFVGRNENGDSFGPMPSERNEQTIDIDRVPQLMEIHKAISKWHEASGLVRSLEGNLTQEQRHTLGMPPR